MKNETILSVFLSLKVHKQQQHLEDLGPLDFALVYTVTMTPGLRRAQERLAGMRWFQPFPIAFPGRPELVSAFSVVPTSLHSFSEFLKQAPKLFPEQGPWSLLSWRPG